MRLVVACTPLTGHVSPVTRIVGEWTGRGHSAVVLTGARFAAAVTDAGADHVALPPGADYDDRRLHEDFPESGARSRLARANADIIRLLAEPLAAQDAALTGLVERTQPAAVMVDTTFLGGYTWKVRTGPSAPPLAVANVTFLTLSGRGVPPAGPGLAPMVGAAGEWRDTRVAEVSERFVVRRGLERLAAAAEQAAGRPVPGLPFDGPRYADLTLALTVPSFEYPRVDLPESVRFVGPVLPSAPALWEAPEWWGELGGTRPVVHVTQGTMDNHDLGRLIGPTITGLSGSDALVVATTGGRPVESLGGRVPPNARVVPWIPYDRLLPHVDVMVTNGGFGGVQHALSHGVPLVVAGDGEDKPEIAARVAWSGAGVRIWSGRPRPGQVRRAVERVLADPSYRSRASRIAGEMAGYDGPSGAVDALESLVAGTL